MRLPHRIRSVSLRTKIIVPVTVILLSAAGLIAFATTTILEQHLRQSRIYNAEKVVRIVEGSIREAMLTGDTKNIRDILETISVNAELPRVSLRDSDGNLVVNLGEQKHLFNSVNPRIPPPGERVIDDIGTSESQFVRATLSIANEPACYQCHSPQKETLGILEVDTPGVWQDQRFARSINLIVTIALITLALVWIAIALSVNAAVIGPMQKLNQAMRTVRGGERTVSVRPDSDDEIGNLETTFNEMVADIAKAEASLVEKEHQLAKAEKLAGIGLMAAGVAHEINNPLAAVSMAAETLERQDIPEETRARLRRSVLEGTQRIQQIVSELLTLDRNQAIDPSEVSVEDLFEESLGLINIPENIVISRNVPESFPLLRVDVAKMSRAIGNILKNAVQAMPDGGTLSLAAIEIDDSIVLSLKDTGYGMKEEVRERIFDPFYSTREVGEGFGLGLAVTHGAVVQHGGQIEVESKEQEGTEFRIILPVSKERLED